MAPQTLHVLLCVECTVFQVHIVKKSNKWTCKLCSAKQTLQRVYGTGSGPDCRNLVQRLNKAKSEIELKTETTVIKKLNEEFEIEEPNALITGRTQRDSVEGEEETTAKSVLQCSESQPPQKKSKWAVFVEEESDSCNNLY